MPPRAGRGRGKRDPKKAADKAAMEERMKIQRDEIIFEEDRTRMEIVLEESLIAKDLHKAKKEAQMTLLLNKYKEIDKLHQRISEIQTTTGKQILKLEDELSRVTMLKEVVTQEKTQLHQELEKIKSDDGGKRVIAQLQSKIKQFEAEKIQKNAEMQEMEDSLNRKLAKQVSENRLMRITMKEQETEAAHRISQLEHRVIETLNELIMQVAAENRDMMASQQFTTNMEKACRGYLESLRTAKESVVGMTDTLVDIKSMHSNLPQRIRTKLQELSQEELLIIVDVLSFEDAVLQYLESRFPTQ